MQDGRSDGRLGEAIRRCSVRWNAEETGIVRCDLREGEQAETCAQVEAAFDGIKRLSKNG